MPPAWFLLRALKFTGFALFSAGVLSAVRPDAAARVSALVRLTTPGLLMTWIAGYLLMKSTGRSLAEPWIAGGLLASLLAFHAAALCAQRPRPRLASRLLGPAALGACVAAMTLRPASAAGLLGACAAGALAGGAAGALAGAEAGTREPDRPSPEVAAALTGWFRAIARLEGASLVFMLFVSMPWRRVTGAPLDGGTGLVGWVHGALVLVYLQALLTASRAAGWGGRTAALGAVASLVPFGTFVFERRLPGGPEPIPDPEV